MLEQPFKNIIVGIDFSPYSKIVVRQAQLLCRMWHAKLVLVHAIHDAVGYAVTPFGDVFFPNLIDEKSYQVRIKKFYSIKNNSTEIIASSSTPLRLITETAKKFENPLILAGYKGHSQIAEFFFGSTAQQLVMNSKNPVWIHRGNKVIRPKKILIPHDLSNASDHSIDVVKKLSLACPTTYEVFHVNQRPFPILDYNTFQKVDHRIKKATQSKIEHLIKQYPRIKVTSTSGDITEKVVKRSKDFDLLVMAHHNPTSLLSKSETITLMKKVRTPVMVTH
jgi:nucleotide-binding universal stress UspA family protein